MKRLLSSIASIAFAAALTSGVAFAKPDHPAMGHAMGHSMSGHAMMTHPKNHRYGNDKARCRDSKGRFLKRSDPRCLAR